VLEANAAKQSRDLEARDLLTLIGVQDEARESATIVADCPLERRQDAATFTCCPLSGTGVLSVLTSIEGSIRFSERQ
jgi:hypothetical protein